MRKLLIAAAVLLCQPAIAADMRMATKAPPVGFLEASQIYYGLGTVATTTNAEITVPTLGTTGTITTAGAGAGGVIGYHKGNVDKFWQVEAAAYWMNLGGEQIVTGAEIRNKVSFNGRFKMGGSQTYANLMALLGNTLGGLGIPAGTGSGQNTMPYAYIGFNVDRPEAILLGIASAQNWQVTPELGLGAITRIVSPTGQPQGCAADASVGYSPAGKGFALGDGVVAGGLANQGRSFKVRAAVLC